jgi:CheY-like chemotaxis protein
MTLQTDWFGDNLIRFGGQTDAGQDGTTNALEALEQWGQSDFDLIFIDEQMREMNSLQAIAQIHREEAIGA